MDVSYNNINFSIVRTNDLVFEPVYTEDGITYLYTKVTIDVDGVINPMAMAYATSVGGAPPVATPSTLPPTTIAAIRHALIQPRQELTISSATGTGPPVIVVTAPVRGEPCDCRNGPLPGACSIKMFAGARTWYVHWSCVTWIHECPQGEPTNSPLISNRYSQEETVNDQFQSTLVTTGQAIFRTDILSADNSGPVADTFRAQVMPPVPAGFRRTRVHVTVVPARNALHYSCTDEQTWYDLGDTQATGSFITKARVNFQISSLIAEGGIPGGQAMGNLSVMLWGDKRASGWIMIQRAFALAAGVLPLGDATKGHIQQISIGREYTDRQIELKIAYLFYSPPDSPIGGIPIDVIKTDDFFPDQAGVNPSPPWGKGTRGTANLKVLAAALEDACTTPPDPDEEPDGDGDGEAAIGDNEPPEVTIDQGNDLPDFPTRYKTPDGLPASYNEYHLETRYRRQENVIQCPTTGPPPNANGNQTGSMSGTGSGSSSQRGWQPAQWPASFFTVAAPTAQILVHWRAERVGTMPQLPSPDNNDGNLVLLHSEPVVVSPQLMPDGQTLVYRVEGEYIFGMKYAYDMTTALAMGVVPWVAANFTDDDVQVPPENFIHGIIDDASGGLSGSTGPVGTST